MCYYQKNNIGVVVSLKKELFKFRMNWKKILRLWIMKRSGSEFVIIIVYFDDLNVISTLKELPKVVECFKGWKVLGKTECCLDLQIEKLTNKIFVHQSTYIEKFWCDFYMDKSHSLSTPMIMRSFEINDDSFWSQEKDEELLFFSKVPSRGFNR